MKNSNTKLKTGLFSSEGGSASGGKLLVVVFTFSFLVFGLATSAFAIPLGPSYGPVPRVEGGPVAAGPATQRLLGIIERLTNWMALLLFALTVTFIVYAGYLYLTAAGDAEQIKKANQVIIYSVVAVGVALLAYVFINIVKTLVR